MYPSVSLAAQTAFFFFDIRSGPNVKEKKGSLGGETIPVFPTVYCLVHQYIQRKHEVQSLLFYFPFYTELPNIASTVHAFPVL